MPEIRLQDHTDTLSEKARLLQAAIAAGRDDLVASLASSIQQATQFERQSREDDTRPTLGADDFVPVADLPPAWAAWAKGWYSCKALSLHETVGLARSHEPVDLTIGFKLDQITDPFRELRVARVDVEEGVLREVPCQVHSETRQSHDRRCHLVFFADVPAHGRASYLIFYGNPNAELPCYSTDLCTEGEGYALKIRSRYYSAELSPQMGQIIRLTSTRQHGVELYAGGHGHGDPATLDWSTDYVDRGGFQKIRIRNWPSCPNFEMLRGPLMVRVRRWGFPASPIHPVLTPARLHTDQTYTFFAGLPYFFKEGRMEAVQDVRIEAMRDDEWVFSGYSFTDQVWLDSRGRLHEGKVPADQSGDLWGVGFYHSLSRDSFIALRLEHSGEGGVSPRHEGAPIFFYEPHGQCWARYPFRTRTLPAGSLTRQKNAYLFQEYEEQGAPKRIEALYHRLRNPLDARADTLPRVEKAKATGALARDGETPETCGLKPAIWDAMRLVRDEQLYTVDANVVDMGYIYDVRMRLGVAHILVTMPHRGRPSYDFLVNHGGGRITPGIRDRLLTIPGVKDVVLDFTWDPGWTAARITDAGRQAIGLTP
jgi:metal-sulfur cluster biosynthetic enzyme